VFSVSQELAGQYQVHAWSGGFSDYVTVYVLHQDQGYCLQNLPPHYTYQLVGSQGFPHPFNHYGTFNAVYKVQQICEAFYNQTGGIQAGVNDMSIPWGGLFDIGPPYGSLWQSPHAAHRTGRNADFPFQYLGTSQQQALFASIASFYGGNPASEGNHYHLTFY
jgi:hypothetical protein